MNTILNKTPFFYLSLILFLLHQFIEKLLNIHFIFIDSYLDCFLFFPIVIPLLLTERRLYYKKNYNFSNLELIIIIIVLSVFFEEIIPLYFSDFTKDYLDYLAYFLGAFLYYSIEKSKRVLNENILTD